MSTERMRPGSKLDIAVAECVMGYHAVDGYWVDSKGNLHARVDSFEPSAKRAIGWSWWPLNVLLSRGYKVNIDFLGENVGTVTINVPTGIEKDYPDSDVGVFWNKEENTHPGWAICIAALEAMELNAQLLERSTRALIRELRCDSNSAHLCFPDQLP